jgi:hypothetical protein
MLITERAQQVSVRAQAYRGDIDNQEQQGHLDAAVARFAKYAERVGGALELLRQARARDVAVPDGQTATLREAGKHAKTLRRELAKPEVGSAVLSRKPEEHARKSAEKVVSHLERMSGDAWEAAWKTAFPDGAPERRIPDLPGIDKKVIAYGKLASRARALRRSLLDDDAAKRDVDALFRRLDELSAEFTEASRALGDALGEFPPEVRRFVHAAADETGASLALVTESVYRWLEENNLLEDYLVKPADGE